MPLIIDFTTLPLVEVASMLRLLGEKQLLNVLRGERQPDLTKLLPLKQTQILVQPSISESSHRPSQADPSDFQYREMVTQAIAGKLSSSDWRAHIVDQLKRDLAPVSPHTVPNDWWLLVSEMAWRDLRFQHRVATEIRSHLRPQLLFALKQMPIAMLSPKTFWVLITLAEVGTPRASSNQQITREAIKRLQDEGQRQASVAGWAGFWDQWLLSEALRHEQNLTQLNSKLRDALLALPLRQKDKIKYSSIKLADPNWKKEMPGWFPSLKPPNEPS